MRASLSVVLLCGPLALSCWGQSPFPGTNPVSRGESPNQRITRLVRTVLNKREVKLVREDALRELVRVTPVRVRVPILLEVLKAEDRDTVEPLGQNWSPTAVQAGFVRFHVVQALMSLPPQEARLAAARLVDRMLNDPVVDVRAISGFTLGRIAPGDDAVISAFVQVLRSGDRFVWQAAAFGLGEAGAQGAAGRAELEALASMGEPRGTDPQSIAVMNAVIEARQALRKLDRAGAADAPALPPTINDLLRPIQ